MIIDIIIAYVIIVFVFPLGLAIVARVLLGLMQLVEACFGLLASSFSRKAANPVSQDPYNAQGEQHSAA